MILVTCILLTNPYQGMLMQGRFHTVYIAQFNGFIVQGAVKHWIHSRNNFLLRTHIIIHMCGGWLMWINIMPKGYFFMPRLGLEPWFKHSPVTYPLVRDTFTLTRRFVAIGTHSSSNSLRTKSPCIYLNTLHNPRRAWHHAHLLFQHIPIPLQIQTE